MEYQDAENILADAMERLRNERERQKLSIKKLAALSGISRTGLGQVEKGQRSPSLLNCLRIADALGIRLGDVLNDVVGSGGEER